MFYRIHIFLLSIQVIVFPVYQSSYENKKLIVRHAYGSVLFAHEKSDKMLQPAGNMLSYQMKQMQHTKTSMYNHQNSLTKPKGE